MLLAATAWSCVKVEKFQFRDGGDELGSDGDGSNGSAAGDPVAKDDAGHIYVESALYRLDFSDGGYRYPDRFRIRGTDVLGPAPPTISCGTEHGAGVTYHPIATVSSVDSTHLMAGSRTLTIEVPGPGVARVGLNWTATFNEASCTSQVATGRSTFTFFPDGRIQRLDHLRLSNTVADASTCGCTTGSYWEVASYWTFLASAFTAASVEGVNGGVPAVIGDSNGTMETACFTGTGMSGAYQVAMTWRAEEGSRMRKVDGTTFAFIGDTMSGGTVADLANLDGDVSTVMMIDDDSNCTALRARALPQSQGPELHITWPGGGEFNGSQGQDGIYGGETSQQASSAPHINASPITITPLLTAVPVPPFALWLEMAELPTITSVSRTHTVQALGNGNYLFWFPDGLTGGETITIEAQ